MQHTTMSSSLFKFHFFLFILLWNRVNDTNTVKNITETDTETKINKERQSASGTMNSVVFVFSIFCYCLVYFSCQSIFVLLSNMNCFSRSHLTLIYEVILPLSSLYKLNFLSIYRNTLFFYDKVSNYFHSSSYYYSRINWCLSRWSDTKTSQ